MEDLKVKQLLFFTILSFSLVATAGDEIKFKKYVLNDVFFSEGCAVADVNKDGKVDVLAGCYWYEAPNWEKHEFREPGSFEYDKGYSDSFINGAMDVNNDGWEDFILIGFPGAPGWWYENPKNEPGYWEKHAIWQSVCNESPHVADLNGDGREDLIFPYAPEDQWAWFEAPKEEGGTKFARTIVSATDAPGTFKFAHGMGVGAINGDGHNDIVINEGWWESPEDPTTPDWTFHPAALGPACAHMIVYDYDQDGDNDIVSSAAHDFGIWWWEQGKDDQGEMTWTQHTILEKEFSQTHSMCFADMNQDGSPDLVTGKRFFAHNGHDPGGHDPAVLYWFEYHVKDGEPVWTPHQIDDDSGVGTQFSVEDITGNGYPDIIISNKKGTFVFENLGS
ncbi:MAG: VCBS repeat-containing protein [Candidatus Omnitrophica bacterium]|nr:VCBS repeat-containing protein [Candidatus Omnitrophota bacterium]